MLFLKLITKTYPNLNKRKRKDAKDPIVKTGFQQTIKSAKSPRCNQNKIKVKLNKQLNFTRLFSINEK